jgi:hypothetical protein
MYDQSPIETDGNLNEVQAQVVGRKYVKAFVAMSGGAFLHSPLGDGWAEQYDKFRIMVRHHY